MRLVAFARMINVLRRRALPEQTRRDVNVGQHALAVFAPRALVVTLEAKGQPPREGEPRVGHVAGITRFVMAEKQGRLLVLAGQQKKERKVKPRPEMIGRIRLEQILPEIRGFARTPEMPLTEHLAEDRAQERTRGAVRPPLHPALAQERPVDLRDARGQFETVFVLSGMEIRLGQVGPCLGAGRIDLDRFFQRGPAPLRRAQTGHVADQTGGHRRIRRHGGAAGRGIFLHGPFRLYLGLVRGRRNHFHLRFPITPEIFPFLRGPFRRFPDLQDIGCAELVEMARHPILRTDLVEFGKNFRRGQRFERRTDQEQDDRQEKVVLDGQGLGHVDPAERPDGRLVAQRLDHAAARSRAGSPHATGTRCLRPSRSW